jgi:flagellar basal-body rod protein FlgC
MSITKGFGIAASGMQAQRVRLHTVASNLANAETTRTADGGPYQRQVPIFQSVDTPQGGSGVRVARIEGDTSEGPVVHDPGHPDADAEGFVRLPNVNVVEEMVDMMTASRSFEANAQAFQTMREMAKQAIEIGRG